eukprot:m.176835 g.176835  ORF g.176835 m.176835 type:complete len:91 (+) comp13537_c0_seq1:110-382(+)
MRGRSQALKLTAGRPLRGKTRVASASRAAEVGCQHQMDKLFDCWKKNDFDDELCSQHIKTYLRCLTQQSKFSHSQPVNIKKAFHELDRQK